MLKKTAIAALALILAICFSIALPPAKAEAQQGEFKMGIFDLQKAVNDSKKGQAAKAKLVKKYENIQKELKKREADIETTRKSMEKQGSMMSPEAKWEKEKELRNKIRDFQDMYNDYTKEMQKEELEVTQPVVEGMVEMASKVGREKGFTVVMELNKSGIIWIPKDFDITEEVVKRYDSQ